MATAPPGMMASRMRTFWTQLVESFGRIPAWCRLALAWMAAILLWFDPSSGVSTVLLYGAGLYALWTYRQAGAAWRNPVGGLVGLGVLWALLSWLWSFDPPGTARDLIKTAPLAMGVWAIPALFDRPGRIWTALVASAGVVTVRLAVDLLRMVYFLGWPSVLEAARFMRPYLYTHPNVSSMMAGLCALVFVARWLAGAPGAGRKAALAAGIALNLAYLVVMASRGPQAVFALALLAMPVLWLPGWRIRLAAAALAVALGFGLVRVAPMVNPRFADHTMGNFNRRDTIWRHAKMLADRRPLLGYGYGKKAFVQAVYHNPAQRAPLVPVHYPHTHSYWLMMYFQGGRVAFVVWSLAWLAMGLRLGRWAGRAEDRVFGWMGRMRARILPVLIGTGAAYILVYGIGDYPDHVIRHVQFYLHGPGRGADRSAASGGRFRPMKISVITTVYNRPGAFAPAAGLAGGADPPARRDRGGRRRLRCGHRRGDGASPLRLQDSVHGGPAGKGRLSPGRRPQQGHPRRHRRLSSVSGLRHGAAA
jgi:O-antigen ligase